MAKLPVVDIRHMPRPAYDTMRPESFNYLRGGGTPRASMSVMLTLYPDGMLAVTDGRHRLWIAKELGHTHVEGVLRVMGPRGGTKQSAAVFRIA